MRLVSRVGATALILPICTLLSACSVVNNNAAALTIGTLYPNAGSQGLQGTQEERGVKLAAEWTNSHGGVHGKSVRLVHAAADRAEAVPDAMQGLANSGVRVVVGTHSSAVSAAAADVAAKDKQLLWETGAVGQTDGGIVGGPNFIRMAPMGANLGRAAISFIRDQFVPKLQESRPLRYAVTYVDDAYGRAVGLGAVDEIQRSNQLFAGAFPYDLRNADFGDLSRRIAAIHPDVLFVSAYLDDGVAMRQALVANKVPLVASIGTSSSYCMPAFGNKLGADAVGLFASDKPDGDAIRLQGLSAEGRETLKWAKSRYKSLYHEAMTAPALSGFSNAYALFRHVLPKVSKVDAASVYSAALRTKLAEGTLPNGGGMDIASPGTADEGNNRNASGVIWEWVGPGQRAVVWPSEFATHAITVLPLNK